MQLEIANAKSLSGKTLYVVQHKDAYGIGKYQVVSDAFTNYKEAKDYLEFLNEVANTDKDPIKDYRNRYNVASNN